MKYFIKMVTNFIHFMKLIVLQKHLILSMARREVSKKYVGSILGFVWTFIHPLVLIFVFWVVFSVGFRVKPTNNVPFVVWLTAGLSAWFVFAEIVSSSVGSVIDNAPLIKKTTFQSQILPLIHILACSVTHLVFLLVLVGLIIFQRMPFSMFYLQVFYYFFALAVFSLGLSWLASALNVFIRDISQIVNVVLQVGMWATPILWDVNIMPYNVQLVLKLNPMFYIVDGYRDSFIYFKPFWEHPAQTIYFWSVTLILFVCGAVVYKKLKPQFADVL